VPAVRVAIRASAANQRTVARGRLPAAAPRRRLWRQQELRLHAGQTCQNALCCTPLARRRHPGAACGASVTDGSAHADLQLQGGLSATKGQCAKPRAARSVAQLPAAAKQRCCGVGLCACGQSPGLRVHSAAPAATHVPTRWTRCRACTANTPTEVLDQTAGWNSA